MINNSIQPNETVKSWMDLGYGLLTMFGPCTLTGFARWLDRNFPAEEFHFPKLDPHQWAEMAADAGMKYAVLAAKNHDGFCLWPSQYTEYCVKNSPGAPDVVGAFVNAF